MITNNTMETLKLVIGCIAVLAYMVIAYLQMEFWHSLTDPPKEKKSRKKSRKKPKRFVQQWIPVTERLPDKHGYYIVQTDGSHNAVIDIAEYGMFFQPEHEDVCEWNKASKVIAWMPLPEPYKGAE